MTSSKAMAWIAVDWGTSNLRVWGIGADGAVVVEASSDKGMGKLERSGFEPALLSWSVTAAPERQTLVIACGMVGAAGLNRVPLSPGAVQTGFPISAVPKPAITAQGESAGGVKQISRARCDARRGPDRRFFANPQLRGRCVFRNPHQMGADQWEIVDFKTFMTGELFNLLATQSVLRRSFGSRMGQGPNSPGPLYPWHPFNLLRACSRSRGNWWRP